MSRAIFEALSGGKTILDAADSAADNTIVVPAATGILPVPTTVGLLNQVLTSSGTTTPTWQYLTGTGTVTSVNGSGGSTGLTLTGGPITSSGTLTLGGLLNATYGGTGASNLIGYMFGNGANPASASLTIPNTSISGLGTMSTQDANAVAITGGSVNGVTSTGFTVLDSGFTLQDEADPTKQAQFQLSGITTATTRSYTLPNLDTTLAGLGQSQTFTAGNTFSANTNTFGSSTGTGTQGLGSGATTTGNTKTVNVGTGGVSGSTTNIAIGSSVSGATSTTTMNGTSLFAGAGYSANFALTDAATVAWDTNNQTATFTFVSSNRTFGAPTNLKNGAFYALAVIQNAGSNTLTWNAVFKWTGGTAPTLSTAASAKDYFVFRSDGTNLYEQGRSLGVA
jgi:hypothetical protein